MRLILAVAVLGVLALNGCGGPAPTPTPTAAPGEPVFASEEEALAAAEAVLDKYVLATDLMSSSGGEDLSGFEGILTPNQLADEVDQANDLKAQGQHLVGSHSYDRLRLQQLDQTNPPDVYMQVYVCLDLTNVKYVDFEGNDTSAQNPNRFAPIEVILVNATEAPNTLLIEDARLWTGEDFCS